jgi:hypothetical protein
MTATTTRFYFVKAGTYAYVTSPAGKKFTEFWTKQDRYFTEGRRKNGWYKFVSNGWTLEVPAHFVRKLEKPAHITSEPQEKELTQAQCDQLDNAYAAHCAEQDEEPDRSDWDADNADLIARDRARHASSF